GMELHGQVPRVPRQLGDLDELAVGGAARNPEPLFNERLLVQAVELVAMTMTLVNEVRAIDLVRERSRREFTRIRAEPHRAAQVVHAKQIAELVDDVRRRVRV